MTRPLPDDLRQRYEAAEQAHAEHLRLHARLARGRRALDEADQQVRTARSVLDDESADVAELESFSAARIWSGLTGRRETDLERERAEQQAAQYAVAQAEAEAEAVALTAGREVAAVTAGLDDLGDPAATRAAVRDEIEQWLRGQGGAEVALLDEVGSAGVRVRAELGEIAEASEAAQAAQRALGAAAGHLDSARGWSTYDTFFGGGMIADAVKYDRIDQAHDRLRVADDALRRLASELADVGLDPVGEVGVSEGQRTFDVFFDNVFSDSRVRGQVIDTQARVTDATKAVGAAVERLNARESVLRREQEDLVRRRDALLGAP